MAKQRYINTKFWSDNFIVQLDPTERYLFLYLLTNEHTNISGIYELPLRTMAFETGLEPEMLQKILDRFDPKVIYVEGWVGIRNFTKHQSSNDKVRAGIERAIKEVPVSVLKALGFDSVPEAIHSLLKATIGPELLNTNSNSNPNRTELFQRFWAAYPLKVGKKKAEKVWEKINPDTGLFHVIMAGLERAKKSRKWLKDNGDYIPHPTTWLNGEHWNDEPEAKVERPKDWFDRQAERTDRMLAEADKHRRGG